MNIIQRTSTPAQPTTRFKLEERTTRPDGEVEITGIETGYDRTSGLRRLDQRIRQHPDRYWGRACRRLVLVEAKDGDR